MQPKARMTFRFDNAAPAVKESPAQPPVQLQGETSLFDDAGRGADNYSAVSATESRAEKRKQAGDDVPIAGQAQRAHPQQGARAKRDARTQQNARTQQDAGAARKAPSAPGSGADFQAWNSPYQDDIYALEEMIRTTEREPAAAKDGMFELQERPARGFSKGGPARAGDGGAERSPDPASQTSAAKRGETIPFPKPYQGRRPADIAESDSPDPLEIPEPPEPPDPFDDTSYRWLHDRSGHRQDGPSWMRVFITVVGAIATGGLFGYLLLTLFTGEPLLPTQGAQSGQGTVAANGEVPVLATPAAGTGGSGASASAVGAQGASQAGTPTTGEVVPSVSLYVLQHGVFRSEESMNEAAEKLRAQGIAAATDASDGYRVYAGISPTKSEADELVSLLAGTEVYVKALSSDSFQIAGVEDVDEYIGFLDASAKLYGKIAGFASATLTGQTPSTDNDLTSIRTAHQVWLEKTGPAASWIETARTYSQTEIEQLNAAVSLLNSYGESPEDELLWKAQTATMNAVFADRQLRSFIELQAGG